MSKRGFIGENTKYEKRLLFKYRALVITLLVCVAYLLSHFLFPLYLYTWWEFLASLVLLLCGISIRAISMGFGNPGISGRSKKLEADSLNVTGPYAWVRNPFHLGNILAALGLTLMTGSLSFSFIMGILLIAYYSLIFQAEEKSLAQKFGIEYQDYKRRVPAFLPLPISNPYKASPWQRFDPKGTLKSECDTWYLLISLATLVSTYRGYLTKIWALGLFLLLTLSWGL